MNTTSIKKNRINFLSTEIILNALKDSFLKLNLKSQIKNPVIFVTEICAMLTTLTLFISSSKVSSFEIQITLWLWFTVLFSNFAEAIAEGRGKAQAKSLKQTCTNLTARLLKNNTETIVSASNLKKGDIVVCSASDLIPSDGEVIEGIATVDESAITGESAPVIRESGGDRSAVTGGTKVLSDRIVIRITAEPGSTFLDKMIALVESAQRQKTPNEIALTIVLSGLTLIFLLAVTTLKFFVDYTTKISGQNLSDIVTVPVLASLFVCLIPTTICALLNAIGISGMDRLIRRNVIATSGKAVETAGDIDVLLIDKTGTITLGNRIASEFLPIQGVDESKLAEIAQLGSIADETVEGRSIVLLAKEKFGLRAEQLSLQSADFIHFSAKTRMSGVNFLKENNQVEIRKGPSDEIKKYILARGGTIPNDLMEKVDSVAKQGGTPLLVTEGKEILGVVYLKDIVKQGIKERFAELRAMGIKTIMITGDNPLTAATIAAESGVDDFVALATPETKLILIKQEQAKGLLVAMTGDGTNDAPALAQADVGVVMNTGTQAAREAGNMVDLDSNPTKLIDIVQIGKQMLMTRGSLTTFSIANDVSKYFAILPALFGSLFILNHEQNGTLSIFNVMGLHSPRSAILSAVIFNALIIVFLIPLALKGIKPKSANPAKILRRNLLIYGLGGLIVPFIGIKIIDVMITALGFI